MEIPQPKRWQRVPLMALALAGLLAGLYGGLLRIGWDLPLGPSALSMAHGPLMVCGFLGTLISLERAVALERAWAYAAPLATGLGGALLLVGVGGAAGPLLVTLGSVGLVAIFGAVLRVQAQPFAQVMALGALAWLVGNAVWLAGAPVFFAVPWWMGFLVLTIAGERLELSRMLLHRPRVETAFQGITAVLVAGLGAASLVPDAGMRLIGAALVALAAWLARYDVARHTVRQGGLTRYIGACLLAGYGWLAVGGGLALAYGSVAGGPLYDAVLHAIFVGFVFSMIFGHAPVIFPSVLGVPLAYRAFLYVHVALLHASLAARLAGDLGGWPGLRRWGGLLNAAAILLFLANTALATLLQRRADNAGGDVVTFGTECSG